MVMLMDENFMKIAIEEAKIAYKNDEIPVGCAIFCDGMLISKAHNCREVTNNSIMHAEIVAISDACKKLCSWRLNNCTLYVTLEPCMMCMGAIIESRIKKVYFGTKNNSEQMYDIRRINKLVNLYFVDDTECSKILSDFFANKRKK